MLQVSSVESGVQKAPVKMQMGCPQGIIYQLININSQITESSLEFNEMGLEIAKFRWYSLPKHKLLPQGKNKVVGITVKAKYEKAERGSYENKCHRFQESV